MKAASDAQSFMQQNGIDGWLTRDYRYTNPLFWQIFGSHVENVTRPVWLMIPSSGKPERGDALRYAASEATP